MQLPAKGVAYPAMQLRLATAQSHREGKQGGKTCAIAATRSADFADRRGTRSWQLPLISRRVFERFLYRSHDAGLRDTTSVRVPYDPGPI